MLTSDSWESCCLSHCSSAGIAGPSHHHSKFHCPLLDGSGHDTEFICCSDLFVTQHNMLRVLFCERVRVHHRERKTGDCVLSPGIWPCPALAQPMPRQAGAKGTGIPGLIGTEAHCSLSAQQACLLYPFSLPTLRAQRWVCSAVSRQKPSNQWGLLRGEVQGLGGTAFPIPNFA